MEVSSQVLFPATVTFILQIFQSSQPGQVSKAVSTPEPFTADNMRLIDVDSFLIKDFISDDTPPYAILSHTWGPEEVTLKDMQAEFGEDEDQCPSNASSRTRASKKKGFLKIRYTCQQAAKEGLKWAWVDTCCIDKTSSAELSEAINSMYRWYNQAEICYAYLVDVTLDSSSGGSESLPSRDPSTTSPGLTLLDEAVSGSRWLTRGFTLQELLAPGDIVFYNTQWADIGSRNGKLRSTLAFATGIDYTCLGSGDHARLEDYSIATRMFWASHRHCTRTEDVAYCLMGIFDVNMPLLYGEGKKAFVRLQEELFKETEDDSLFAWSVAKDSDRAWCPSSIFAESPADFARSGGITRLPFTRNDPSIITKLGLSIDLGREIISRKEPRYLYERFLVYYPLACTTRALNSPDDLLSVQIALLPVLNTGNTYEKTRTGSFCRFNIPGIQCVATSSHYYFSNRCHIRKNLPPQHRHKFHHGTISFLVENVTYHEVLHREIKSSPYFSEIGGYVEILIDPWAITDTVAWCIIRFKGYFFLAIGLGPNILHCYANTRKPELTQHSGMIVHDKLRELSATCADYRRKKGLLASDEVTSRDGTTWRVELSHDLLPCGAHTSIERLHLLVDIWPTNGVSSPCQQQPAAPVD